MVQLARIMLNVKDYTCIVCLDVTHVNYICTAALQNTLSYTLSKILDFLNANFFLMCSCRVFMKDLYEFLNSSFFLVRTSDFGTLS